jgi:hypothetical protein
VVTCKNKQEFSPGILNLNFCNADKNGSFPREYNFTHSIQVTKN